MFSRTKIAITLLTLSQLFAPWLIANNGGSITEESRINIIRTLGSEFIALKVPLPINKSGLTVNSKGEFDWKKNEEESVRAGQFIAPGITVQITNVSFTDREVLFEINGG